MIILIIFLGFIARMINLNQSLWLDEAINVLAARNLPFWQFVTGYPIGDFHPPGYFAILWLWGRIFGFSEISVRFPSVIFGVLTIYLTYLIGKNLFSKRVGLIAAILLALSPLHVYYSQEARMYSFAAFAASLSFYCFTKIIQGKRLAFIFFGLANILVLYSDYLAYFVFPAQLTYLLLERERRFEFIKGYLISLIGFIPWLLVFPQQLLSGKQTAVNVPGWAKVVGGPSLKNLLLVFIKAIVGRVSLVDKILYAVLVTPILFIYAILILAAYKVIQKEKKLIIAWLFVPLVLACIFSFWVPVLAYFRMVFVLPALYLILSLGISTLGKKSFFGVVTSLILVSLSALSAYYFNPSFQREDWRGVASFINSQSVESVALFEDSNLPAPFSYYNTEKVKTIGAISNFPAKTLNDIREMSVITYGSKKVFLVDYLVEISDPQRLVDKALTDEGWRVVRVYDFVGVGFIYEYSR